MFQEKLELLSTTLNPRKMYHTIYITLYTLQWIFYCRQFFVHEFAWSKLSFETVVLTALESALGALEAVCQLRQYQDMIAANASEERDDSAEPTAGPTCNICCEAMSDAEAMAAARVCACGYQVCPTCVVRISQELRNKCPHCGQEYTPGEKVPVRHEAAPEAAPEAALGAAAKASPEAALGAAAKASPKAERKPETDFLSKRFFKELEYQTEPKVDDEGKCYPESCKDHEEWKNTIQEYNASMDELREVFANADKVRQERPPMKHQVLMHVVEMEYGLEACKQKGIVWPEVPVHKQQEACVLKVQKHSEWLLENFDDWQCYEIDACNSLIRCHELLTAVRLLREAHPELPSAELALCNKFEVDRKLRKYMTKRSKTGP